MQIGNLPADKKRAVSPVIGVILMVAITVILAAVVGSFVLGFGDEAKGVQPNVAFTTAQEGNQNFTITVDSADADADPADFVVEVEGQADSNPVDFDNQWSSVAGDLSAGDSYTIDLNNVGPGNHDFGNSGDELEVTIVFETDATSSVVEEYTITPQ